MLVTCCGVLPPSRVPGPACRSVGGEEGGEAAERAGPGCEEPQKAPKADQRGPCRGVLVLGSHTAGLGAMSHPRAGGEAVAEGTLGGGQGDSVGLTHGTG